MEGEGSVQVWIDTNALLVFSWVPGVSIPTHAFLAEFNEGLELSFSATDVSLEVGLFAFRPVMAV
jgi:hypothetical protein